QFYSGPDQLLEAVVSGQDCFSSHGPEDDVWSDRLRQTYQGIQRHIAEEIRRALERDQQNRDQQNKDRQNQGEQLRAELQGARNSLHDSQAQAEVLSRKRERHADQRIRWTTQQLRAISDTLEQLEPQ
ncbi:hypothetical protein CRUP_023154, partial [Coryphaenoides rupestris]